MGARGEEETTLAIKSGFQEEIGVGANSRPARVPHISKNKITTKSILLAVQFVEGT